MKKEKTIKTHTRKTKSGKTVTVKQHTAKYEAAEDIVKEALKKKKGAGDEFAARKKKPEPVKEAQSPYDDFGFTKDEFKEWYEGTGSAADKKVEKALRKALGRKAYNELSDNAADNYRKGGASKFFEKNVSSAKSAEAPAKSKDSTSRKKTGREGQISNEEAKKEARRTEDTIAYQKKYLKHLKDVVRDSREKKAMASYMAAEEKILKDLQKHKGKTLKSDEEMQASEDKFRKEHKLTYEEDGIFSAKDGKCYRLSTHPITGVTTAHPLVGYTMGATYNQCRRAGLKGRDYDTVDYDKLEKIIWGDSSEGTPKKSSKSSGSKTPTSGSGLSKQDLAEIEYPHSTIKKIAKKYGASERAVGAWIANGDWKGMTEADHKAGVSLGRKIRKNIGDEAYNGTDAVEIAALGTSRKFEAKKRTKSPTSKKPSKPTAETPESLRQRADKMEASSQKKAARESAKKLIEQGYTKYRSSHGVFYHKGKEGSIGGSYRIIQDGKVRTPMPSLKEHLKATIAKKQGKSYKPKNLK